MKVNEEMYDRMMEVRDLLRVLRVFRCPHESRCFIEMFYNAPIGECDGDTYVADKLFEFEQNPCSWALSLDDQNLAKLLGYASDGNF